MTIGYRTFPCPCGRAPIWDSPGRCVNHKGMDLPAVMADVLARAKAREAAPRDRHTDRK